VGFPQQQILPNAHVESASGSSSDQEEDRDGVVKLDEGGLMTKPKERNGTDVLPRERVEDGAEETGMRRAAPIDEDVLGELNAVLPEEHPEKEGSASSPDDERESTR
jgi:hypothetical protein